MTDDDNDYMPAGTIDRLCRSDLVETTELARLRAIEKAVRSWLAQLDANKDPQMLYEADVALELRDMLAARKKASK